MRKNLVALALAGSVLATPVSALEDKDPTANAQESQELYPDLKGNNVVSFEFTQFSGVPAVSIEFNTDDDYFGDIKYFYLIGSTEKNLIHLTNPFAVTIDKNRDQQIDKDETIYLNGKTSEYSEPEKDTGELYPKLKGDHVFGFSFDQFKDHLVAYIQYSIDNDGVSDIMYTHKIHKGIGNSVLLEEPFAVFFDRNKNHIFEFNSEEMISLEEEPQEPVKPTKKEFEI